MAEDFDDEEDPLEELELELLEPELEEEVDFPMMRQRLSQRLW